MDVLPVQEVELDKWDLDPTQKTATMKQNKKKAGKQSYARQTQEYTYFRKRLESFPELSIPSKVLLMRKIMFIRHDGIKIVFKD